MTLSALASALDSAGIRLGLRLVIDAPAGAVTPEIRDALTEHRANLLMALARESQWEALRDQRWGPAVGDPEPGIVTPAGGTP